MRQKYNELEINQKMTSLQTFLETYNREAPNDFPVASVKNLENFKAQHPMLFKKDDKWSIDKHRKRVMDWLVSHGD